MNIAKTIYLPTNIKSGADAWRRASAGMGA
jgi:hypothetical protein